MQIQVFRGAPFSSIASLNRRTRWISTPPSKVGRELSAREDLCVSHSILQLSKVSGRNTGLHKKSIPSDPVSKTFQYFCDASKVPTMKFDAAELFLYTLRSGVSLHTKEKHNSAATSATFLSLDSFFFRNNATPRHSMTAAVSLSAVERKKMERERPTCEKGASKKNPPWKVKCVDPSSHPNLKINGKI